jgi:hypothetical protein
MRYQTYTYIFSENTLYLYLYLCVENKNNEKFNYLKKGFHSDWRLMLKFVAQGLASLCLFAQTLFGVIIQAISCNGQLESVALQRKKSI